MSWNGTVRCGHCYGKGHNRSGCPDLIEAMEKRLKADPDDWRAKRFFEKKKNRGKNKKCSYCQNPGHTRPTCKELKYAKLITARVCGEWRKKFVEALKAAGVGIGALVKYSIYGEEKLGLVSGIVWDALDHRINVGYSGNYNALTVVPVSDISTGRKTQVCIPVTEELFSEESFPYYKDREVDVVSPIDPETIGRQVPSDFFSGTSCIDTIFRESQASADRVLWYEVKDWCDLQGFYSEESAH